MVYVDSRNLGYKPYIWRWLNTRTKPGEAEALQLLFDRIAVPAIDWVCEGMDGHDIVKKPLQRVPHTNLNMVAQLCRLLDATIIDHPKMEDPQVGAVASLVPHCSDLYLRQLLCRSFHPRCALHVAPHPYISSRAVVKWEALL
jgi:hypothetical protein